MSRPTAIEFALIFVKCQGGIHICTKRSCSEIEILNCVCIIPKCDFHVAVYCVTGKRELHYRVLKIGNVACDFDTNINLAFLNFSTKLLKMYDFIYSSCYGVRL